MKKQIVMAKSMSEERGILSLIVVVVCLLLISVVNMNAESWTNQPDATAGKDTFVYDGATGANYGTSTALSTQNRNPTLHRRSFIEFDLSAFPLPEGQVITHAYLELYQYYVYETNSPNTTLSVYRVTNSWSESTLTWSNQPGDAGTAYGSVTIDNTHDDSWRSFDITDLVKKWYAGVTNCGMVIRTPTLGYTKGAAFRSSDADANQRPKLIVSYGPIPSEGSWTNQPDAFEGKDVAAYEHEPDTNRGTEEYLLCRQASGVHGYGYLQFDLSGIPAVRSVKNARLELYQYANYTATATATASVYRVTNSWSESTLTWNNQPGDADVPYGEVILDNTHVDSWRSFDITDLVQEWHNGTYTNNGLVVRAQSSDYSKGAAFRSSDAAASLRPKLIVDYYTIIRGTLIVVK